MEKVFDILQEVRPELDFRELSSFASDGYLDSFDIISLVSEFEDRFDILIDALDVVPDNFDSVEAMVALIEKSGGEL